MLCPPAAGLVVNGRPKERFAMLIGYVAVAVVAAAMNIWAASLDFRRAEQAVANVAAVEVPPSWLLPLGALKFAGAIGRLAKTDAIDANVIAHFADAIRSTPKPMPDDLMLRLRELLARRRQLVIMINAEKQRLAKAADKLAQRSFKTILRSLEAERARIDRAIDKLIEDSPLGGARFVMLVPNQATGGPPGAS